jgi:multidrug efflux pump subunit AcrA (membrane-fusion protein)
MSLSRRAAFLLCCSVAVSACKQNRSAEEGAEGEHLPALVQVRTAPVMQGPMSDHVSAQGAVDVLRKQHVVSPVNGVVVAVRILEGTHVHRGDILITIRPKEAQAGLTGARLLLQRATTEAERVEAQRAVDLAEATQNSVTLHAEWDGIVAARSVTEGEIVAENAALMDIIDPTTAVFIARVPISDMARVRAGMQAELEIASLSGRALPAVVDAVYPTADAPSQTVAVRVRPAAAAGQPMPALLPAMIGTCRIAVATHHDVLTIPRGALLRNDETGTYTVIAVGSDSLAHVMAVQVVLTNDSLAGVTGRGLAPGMPVVIEGNYGLPDSTRVVVIEDHP